MIASNVIAPKPLIVEISADSTSNSTIAQLTPNVDDVLDDAIRSSDDDRIEVLSTVLSLLTTILGYGSEKRSQGEEHALRELLPFLQHIASHETNASIAQSSTDLAVAIMTRSIPHNEKQNQVAFRTDESVTATCNDAWSNFLQDEHPAMRALGVRNINMSLKKAKTVF